jgi:hypothetical protein
MESYTFAGTSARRYRIVDAEERFTLNSFQYSFKFLCLKSIDINKANKSKNIRFNIDFTFHQQKRGFQKKIC